jgi:Holliday junction resolvase
MAKTPEKKVKDSVVELLKQYKAYYFFPVMGGYGRSGIPDIIACLRGQFIGIECKAGFNKTTLLQDRELAEIERAGGKTLVVREDTMDLLEQLLKEIKHGER